MSTKQPAPTLKKRMKVKVQNITKFDEYRIVQHYVRMRQVQQQRLANINLSEQLKRKLFGFSEGYYLTNTHDPYRLIIENHPLKGRTVMSEHRHYQEQHAKNKEREILGKIDLSSVDKDYSQERLYMDSDIQVPFPAAEEGSDSPNPEFHHRSETPLQQDLQKKLEIDSDP